MYIHMYLSIVLASAGGSLLRISMHQLTPESLAESLHRGEAQGRFLVIIIPDMPIQIYNGTYMTHIYI